MNQAKVFTQKNIYNSILRFSIPAIITILMAELYNMVDTFFVGRYTGEYAIGALSIAFPIQRMIIAMSLMIGVGTATAISHSLGERNFDKMKQNINTSIGLGLIIHTAFPILVFLFFDQILTGLGARNEIFALSKSYIQIVVFGSLFLGFTNIFGYEITAMGEPKVTLIATSIGASINIIIDYILVAKLYMGVEGAAIATLFSQFVACSYSILKMNQYRKNYEFSLRPKIKFAHMKNILAIGFATFIVEISDAVLIATLNNVLLPIGGDHAIIIVGAITRVSMFMYITIIGISSGMQPLASYSHGAKDYERLDKIVVITCKLVTGSSFLLWLFVMIFTHQIIGSFMKEAHLLSQTVDIFRLTIIVFPTISLYYVCIYYCQSIGNAKLGFFLSIYRQILLFLPILFILTNYMGIMGAWITYPVTDVISAITGTYYLVKNLRGLKTSMK